MLKNEYLIFITDAFADFVLVRDLSRLPVLTKHQLASMTHMAFGFLIEIIDSIEEHDAEGFKQTGIDLSEAEKRIIRNYRHGKFHVPKNEAQYRKRSELFFEFAYGNRKRLEENVQRVIDYMEKLKIENPWLASLDSNY